MLFLSVDARFPRVYLTSSPRPVPQQAPDFCMVLRKHVEGAFVAEIEQVGFDRVLRLRTARHGEPERVLILEIMGKHSNLILTDDAGKILGAAKHIGASVSRYRQILPGREYIPPPGSGKLDLLELDPAALDGAIRSAFERAADPAHARAWLVENLSGFGPFLADEMVARATVGEALDTERLREELTHLADIIRGSRYEPVLITSEAGVGLMVYPIRSVQFPADRQHPRYSINEPLDALFRSLVARTQLEDKRKQIITAMRRAIAARRQTMKSIERTIDESAQAKRFRQIGELILASLHKITPGDRTARVTDYFDPEMPEIEIDLDEKLTPQ
ncbi:MAG: Rqc2 family fibronectin-binding protein, partial [Armatimonadota bacterium]